MQHMGQFSNNQTNQLASDLFLHDLNSNRTNPHANSNNNINQAYGNTNGDNHFSSDIFSDFGNGKNNNQLNYNNNNNQNGYDGNSYGYNQQESNNQGGSKFYKNPKYNFDSRGNIVNKDTKNRVR